MAMKERELNQFLDLQSVVDKECFLCAVSATDGTGLSQCMQMVIAMIL